MASDEERVLEHQLEGTLHEQKESLAALQDALASDASNPELLAVHYCLRYEFPFGYEEIHNRNARNDFLILMEFDYLIIEVLETFAG